MRTQAIYYDGQTPTSREVDVAFYGQEIVLFKDGQEFERWPVREIFIDKSHLVVTVLGCRTKEGARLELKDPSFIRHLGLTDQWRTPQHLRAARGLMLAGLIVVVSLIGLFAVNIRLVSRFVMKAVSIEREREFADAIIEYADFDFCSLTPEQDEALKRILTRLDVNQDQLHSRIRVRLVNSMEPNAFAFPGDILLLNSGLLKKASGVDELAGVLAHEIEHLRRRHSMESLIRVSMAVALFNLALGDVSAFLVVDPSTAAQLLSMRYSQDIEREADTGAAQILRKAGVSTAGIVEFFERFGRKQDMSYLNYLSTHPPSHQRIEFFKTNSVDQTKPEVLSKAEWSTLQTVCD